MTAAWPSPAPLTRRPLAGSGAAMPRTREAELRWRLAANGQRRARERYLATLPGEFRQHLTAASFVCSPRLDEMKDAFYIAASGVGVRSPFAPKGYHFHEVNWPNEILGVLGDFGNEYDSVPAYFKPHMLEDDVPAFSVSFGWVRSRLDPLLQASSYHGLALLSEDRTVGIVVDHYCASDRNPGEVVYEVAYWRRTS